MKLTRRSFCVGLGALPLFAAADHRGILLTAEQAARLRANPVPDAVRRNASAALNAGPWSVTTHRPDHVSIAPNDYYSEGP